MVKLNAGNVLLKPSHRRQLMGSLRRAERLGERLGNFLLTISMRRNGHVLEVRADGHVASANFALRVRRPDWRDALRELIRMIWLRVTSERQHLTMA